MERDNQTLSPWLALWQVITNVLRAGTRTIRIKSSHMVIVTESALIIGS